MWGHENITCDGSLESRNAINYFDSAVDRLEAEVDMRIDPLEEMKFPQSLKVELEAHDSGGNVVCPHYG